MCALSYKEFSQYVAKNSCNFKEIHRKALELVQKNNSQLGYDVYSVYEQLVISSVFVGDEKSVKNYLDKLKSTFSESDRVNVLFGLVLERMKRYDDAMHIYEQITESHPHPLALKRMITVTKLTKGDLEAIPLLVSYLKIYMNDQTAWMELTDLYINQRMYEKAKFCVEELIMLAPNQTAFLEKYAKIVLVSKDDLDAFLMARKYLCFALCINANSTSILKTLLDVCNKIEKFKLQPKEDSNINTELSQKATLRYKRLIEN